MKTITQFAARLPLPIFIISAILLITSYSVATYLNLELYFILGIIGICLLWIMMHYPKIWIYLVVIGCVLFFDEDEEGIWAVDIFAALFFNVFLIIWFVSKILVKSEKKIAANDNNPTLDINPTLKINNLTEKLFLLFYILLLFNSIIAVANGISILDWIREYMLFTLMLYYFPVRDYFDDKYSIMILLVLFALVAIRFDVRQFFSFRTLMSNISFAWQIGVTSWKINQGFYSAVILTGTTLFLYSKNKFATLFSYFIVVLTTFALIVTFSRAYWMSVLVLIAILGLFYVRPKQLLQLLVVVTLTVGLAFATLDAYFPKHSKYVQKFITKKFTSTTQGKSDKSVEARLREYEVVTREIFESPIYGQGFRKQISFYDNVWHMNQVTSFVHNGYLNLAHKTGIPMAFLFYLTIALFNIKGYIVGWKLRRYCIRNKLDKKNDLHFFTAIVIGASLTLTMFAITNMVTSSFFMRDGFIMTAFSLAFVSIAERKFQEINK